MVNRFLSMLACCHIQSYSRYCVPCRVIILQLFPVADFFGIFLLFSVSGYFFRVHEVLIQHSWRDHLDAGNLAAGNYNTRIFWCGQLKTIIAFHASCVWYWWLVLHLVQTFGFHQKLSILSRWDFMYPNSYHNTNSIPNPLSHITHFYSMYLYFSLRQNILDL